MQLKTFLFSVLPAAIGLMFACNASYAQDKIVKKNGDVIDVKIKTVGVKTITYVRFDNQSGPEYTIIKNEVEKIIYQNGSEDVISMGRAARGRKEETVADEKEKIKYNPNILAIAPLQFSENGLGFALSYERALDKKGIIAFYLPAILTLDLSNGTYYNTTTGTYQNGHQDAMGYIMPGIKVYPTGSFGIVRYAVGPALVVGVGQKSSTQYDPYTGYPQPYVTQDHFVLGMIVNNSLNINPGPHIYLGLDFGLGFSYLNRVGGLNQDTEALVQGGFKIGYRF